jgi:exodeoxyribonuclease VII small subunit
MAKKKATEAAEALPPYEQAIEQLEQIIAKLESGEIGLEDGIAQYESGMKLIAHCRSVLDRAEQKIRELSVEDGSEDRATDEQE